MSGEVLATQTKLSSLTKKVSDDEVHLQQLTDAKQAAVTGKSWRMAEAHVCTFSIRSVDYLLWATDWLVY